MTGTTIAQAIPIAISPILTRLYSPKDFGVLALFVAITSIFGSIANGRYELAIMLPKKDEDAINIAALGVLIVLCLSSVLLIVIVLFHDLILELLGNEQISTWLYFVPLVVLLVGLYNVLNYYNNRLKNYKDLAQATIIKSIASATIQLVLGFMKAGVSGLISGQIISQFFANMKLLKNITKDKALISKVSKIKIIALARRYKDFPKFSMWAVLANSLSHNLTNILISTIFSIATLGYYSLVQRMLAMPSSLIGSSISQVYFRTAKEEKEKYNKATDTFNSTLKKLIIISVSFIILYFIVEDLFAFIFGEEWRVAGSYAKILIPFYMINFISSPLAITMSLFEKQKEALVINLILIFTSIGTILFAKYLHIGFENFLYFFSTLMFFEYLLFIVYYKKVVKG
jgi:O-antigen/teichoic acid export membrane protein